MGNCHYPCSFYMGTGNFHSKSNSHRKKSISTSKLVNVIPDDPNPNGKILISNNTITKANHKFNVSTVVPEIIYNDKKEIRQDIIEGHHMDKTGLQFKGALHSNNNIILAIKKGDVVTVKRLLDDGHDVDVGTFGSTPLIISCQYGHKDITQLILDQMSMNEKIINHCNEKRVTALLYASMNGDITIVEKLVSLGAEKFPEPSMPIHNPITDDSRALTPLSAAIINGHTPVVKFFLEKMDSIDQVFNFSIGKSIIIDKNTLVSSPSNVTPLLLAASYGKLDIIKELLIRNADWKLIDDENSTILHHICKLHDDLAVSILDAFKSHGCNIDELMICFDKNGDTALHVACDHKNIGIISYLIQNKMKVNIKNTVTGITPLHIAVRRRNDEIIKLLLANKADPKIVDIQNISCIDMISKLRKDSEIHKLITNNPRIEQSITLENVDDFM